MGQVKSVKIDGEEIYLFNSAIYLFVSSSGRTLELDLIVSEVALKKYKDREQAIVEIELEDGRIISSFMFLKSVPGELPQLNVFFEPDEQEEFEGIQLVHEHDLRFPNIEAGLTLADIRKVEMPIEKVTLKLNLPIDKVEWLKKQKQKELNRIFTDLIDKYWREQ